MDVIESKNEFKQRDTENNNYCGNKSDCEIWVESTLQFINDTCDIPNGGTEQNECHVKPRHGMCTGYGNGLPVDSQNNLENIETRNGNCPCILNRSVVNSTVHGGRVILGQVKKGATDEVEQSGHNTILRELDLPSLDNDDDSLTTVKSETSIMENSHEQVAADTDKTEMENCLRQEEIDVTANGKIPRQLESGNLGNIKCDNSDKENSLILITCQHDNPQDNNMVDSEVPIVETYSKQMVSEQLDTEPKLCVCGKTIDATVDGDQQNNNQKKKDKIVTLSLPGPVYIHSITFRRVTSEPYLSHSGYPYRPPTYCRHGSIAGMLLSRRYDVKTDTTIPSLWSSSKREKALLLCVLLANMCAMMCLSVMAPFFPSEAEKKGVNLTLSGWIFGVFALTEFIFAPIWGKLVSVINPRFMFLAGMFFAGSCYILFGMMQYVPSTSDDYIVYLTLCFTLRIFTAMGCSALSTSTYTITASTFPYNIATVFGLIETSTGLGMSLGPTIGGILYDLGGFVLPFYSLGGLMIVMVPFSKVMLPPTIQEQKNKNKAASTSALRLLRVPAIQVTCMCVLVAAVALSVPEPTLEPHLLLLPEYNLSSTMIGLIFLLMSGSYGILAPFFGLLCDRLKNTTPLLVMGFLLSGIAFMLLGPSPHFGFAEGYNVLWLNLFALFLLGAGLSLATVPTFDKILRSADKAGFEDNINLYGVVAGLWGSFNAFGDFIGLSTSGFLCEHYTFHWSMTYFGYSCWALAFICLILWIYENTRGDTQVIDCCCCCNHDNSKYDRLTEYGKKEEQKVLITSVNESDNYGALNE